MKVDAKKFVEAMGRAVKVVNPRSPKEALKYVHCSVGDGIARLRGVSDAVSVTVSVPVSGNDRFETLLPVRLLEAMKLNGGELEITAANGKVSYKSAAGRQTFSVPDVDLFPAISAGAVLECVLTIPGGLFAAAVRLTTPFTTYASKMAALSHVLIHTVDGNVFIVCLDGCRASVFKAGSGETRYELLVNPQALNLIDGSDPVDISTDGRAVSLRQGSVTVSTRVPDCKPLDYRSALRDALNGEGDAVNVAVSAMVSSCKAASLTASEETTGVELLLSKDNLAFKSMSAGIGLSELSVPVSNGYEASATVDCKKLTEILTRLPQQDTVDVHFGPKTVRLVHGNLEHVLMTLRLQ